MRLNTMLYVTDALRHNSAQLAQLRRAVDADELELDDVDRTSIESAISELMGQAAALSAAVASTKVGSVRGELDEQRAAREALEVPGRRAQERQDMAESHAHGQHADLPRESSMRRSRRSKSMSSRNTIAAALAALALTFPAGAAAWTGAPNEEGSWHVNGLSGSVRAGICVGKLEVAGIGWQAGCEPLALGAFHAIGTGPWQVELENQRYRYWWREPSSGAECSTYATWTLSTLGGSPLEEGEVTIANNEYWHKAGTGAAFGYVHAEGYPIEALKPGACVNMPPLFVAAGLEKSLILMLNGERGVGLPTTNTGLDSRVGYEVKEL